MQAPRAQAEEILPDLGKSGDRAGAFSVRPDGVTFENTFDRKKIVLAPEYSNQTGLSLGAALAAMLGDNAAVGVLLTAGNDKKELLVNAGFRLDQRQRFIFTAGQLEQFLDYAFLSGSEKVGITQNSGGVSYQLQLGQDFLRFLEINGYVAKTPSRDLADKTFAIDTATLYELWNDPRRIAGGKVTGLQGRLGFAPLAGSTVKVSLGQERLSYDLLAGSDSVNRVTSGIEWLQQLGSGYNVKVAADSFASQNSYTLGVERSLAGNSGRYNLGLSLVGLRGRDGLGDDNQVKLTYSYAFGGSGHAPANPMAQNPMTHAAPGQPPSPAGGNLLDQVALRPGFIPSHVVAKVDNTALPTRLIAVDKTALPAGASVNATTGDVTAPLGVAVTGIAGVTKNLAAFANAGQFSLAGNSLVIKPSLIVQPAVGITDSYIITLNNLGGGTTLVTVLVSHGSVRIDSIAITAGAGADVTAPPTPATLTLTGNAGASAGFTNTTAIGLAVAAVADPSGVSWFVSESSSAPVVGDAGWSSTQPTSFVLSAGDGVKNVYVYVKDNVGNVQATGKSASIALDTALPTIAARAAWGVAAGGATIAGRSVTFNDTAGGTAKTVAVTASSGSIANLVPGAFGAATTFDFVAPANNSAAAVNVTITYSVTDRSGNVSSTTDTVSVAAAVPATPTGLNVTWPNFSWNAVAGATSYSIEDIDASVTINVGNVTSFDIGVWGASPGETLSITATNAFGITSAAAATIVVP